ncbi:MAG: M48 family metalloprotease [bacterium]|nr:M48 family metalloprotease [bacterium]
MVGAIALIADGYRRTLWFGSGRTGRASSKDSSKGIILVIGIVLSILAPIAALIMQASISRKREYLADATSARLTRNPIGLASALAKIEQSMQVNPLPWINRATVHLFIVNPLRNDEMQKSLIFSTHPPTNDRITRLRAMASMQGKSGTTYLSEIVT